MLGELARGTPQDTHAIEEESWRCTHGKRRGLREGGGWHVGRTQCHLGGGTDFPYSINEVMDVTQKGGGQKEGQRGGQGQEGPRGQVQLRRRGRGEGKEGDAEESGEREGEDKDGEGQEEGESSEQGEDDAQRESAEGAEEMPQDKKLSKGGDGATHSGRSSSKQSKGEGEGKGDSASGAGSAGKATSKGEGAPGKCASKEVGASVKGRHRGAQAQAPDAEPVPLPLDSGTAATPARERRPQDHRQRGRLQRPLWEMGVPVALGGLGRGAESARGGGG